MLYSEERQNVDLHAFNVDAGADKLLPDQRGFGVSTGDWIEDVGFHVDLFTQLNFRHRNTHGQFFLQTLSSGNKY